MARGRNTPDRVIAALNDESWSDRLQVEVQALRIGDLAIAAFPSEIFSADSRSIRADSPAPHTMVAGWSNGLFGYAPTRRAVERGGYEAETAFRILRAPRGLGPDKRRQSSGRGPRHGLQPVRIGRPIAGGAGLPPHQHPGNSGNCYDSGKPLACRLVPSEEI